MVGAQGLSIAFDPFANLVGAPYAGQLTYLWPSIDGELPQLPDSTPLLSVFSAGTPFPI